MTVVVPGEPAAARAFNSRTAPPAVPISLSEGVRTESDSSVHFKQPVPDVETTMPAARL